MDIRSLFEKNLFRPINGVVKADQQDASVIWQELEEYVVTKELDRHFRNFFEVYTNALYHSDDPAVSGSMGVWISGFFGSGKSHFLKILSYILKNREAFDSETGVQRRAVDFFKDKISDAKLMADIQASGSADADVILFNIDSRANSRDGGEAILNVFWRVFNEMRGYYGEEPHIAAMEQHLDERGLYEKFQNKFEELCAMSWKENRDSYQFYRDDVITALAFALEQSEEAAGKWFDDEGRSFVASVDNFAKEVANYIKRKGGERRVVFLVDEVGQFIGNDTHRMLQLQTITENLGTKCQGRAWVIVTSQADIEAVLGEVKVSKANDFSKIQGRFKTKLSLSSSNTDEVIQYRLLRKTDEASFELAQLYQSKKDILSNQLSFTGDCATLKNFSSEKDFVSNYPFAPYHFQLIQKVFESIRKAGATGAHLSRGERSMLDAFQSAARSFADKETGILIPLYAFYPSIESFLDTAVKATIDRADDNPGLIQPLDGQLLRTLFLIRYVELIKPNVDNLVTLFIDEVDTDRIALKRSLEESLQRLEKETLINRNGDLYYFLTNEERDISREIKREEVSASDQRRLLQEIVFDDLLSGSKKFRMKEYRRDYDYHCFLDSQLYGKGLGDGDMAIELITQFNDDFMRMGEPQCIMHTVNNPGRILFKLAEDPRLESEVNTWCQTEKYLRGPKGAADSIIHKKILRDRADENVVRRQAISRIMTDLLLQAEVYATGKHIDLPGTARTSVKSLAEGAFDYFIRNTYNKFPLLRSLQSSEQECQKEIKAVLLTNTVGQQVTLTSLNNVNPEAVKEVENFIKLRGDTAPSLKEILDRFGRKPYGWPEWEIVLLAARLYIAGAVTLIIGGDSGLDPRAIAEQLLKSQKWGSVVVKLRHKPAEADIRKAKMLYQDITGKMIGDSADEVVLAFRDLFKIWKENFDRYQRYIDTGRYPGAALLAEAKTLVLPLAQISDSALFARDIAQKADELRYEMDYIRDLADFFKNQKSTWDKMLSALDKFQACRSSLEKDVTAFTALKKLESIRRSPDPYGQIKDIDGLVEQIEGIAAIQLAESKGKALGEIDAHLATFKASLDHAKADAAGCNAVLSPLQRVRVRVENAATPQDVAYILQDLDSARDEAADALERVTAPKSADNPSVKTPSAPQKERVHVKVSQVVGHRALETEEDVERFTEALKKQLLSRLHKNIRLIVD